MKNIISIDWLYKHLEDENQVIIDCRFNLSNPKAGFRAYHEAHIKGAIYMDLEKDLSSEKKEHGGRHPLPDMEEFLIKIENAGIDENTRVIAYDDGTYGMASRLWWLLKYVGHREVFILDGGYKLWTARNLPTTNIIFETSNEKKKYTVNLNKAIAANMSDVKESIRNGDAYLIDARAPERYAGKMEPIDPISGHIPTAKNHFFQNNLKDGVWKSTEELKNSFQYLTDKKVISYCGSGVTACVNVLAMDEAGITSILYVGSWSDWSSYIDNPIEK